MFLSVPREQEANVVNAINNHQFGALACGADTPRAGKILAFPSYSSYMQSIGSATRNDAIYKLVVNSGMVTKAAPAF